MDNNLQPLNYNSVEIVPAMRAAVAFTDSANVFREDEDIAPVVVNDKVSYMPWGADNEMPFGILRLIESDETLSTCQIFNAEVLYGAGLRYDTTGASGADAGAADAFFDDNDMCSYFLGVCQDFKHFAFAVSVLYLSRDGHRVCHIERKEACYCRFEPADASGHIPGILYANWRKTSVRPDSIERIPLLERLTVQALRDMAAKGERKIAVVSRIPTPDHTYYPIPYYAALFRGRWYNIKRLIAMAKEAKLKNSAPVKYHVEINSRYWSGMFQAEGITNRAKQQERVVEEKKNIMRFITGAENAGKVWFSTFYVNPDGQEQHDVVIHRIDDSKEGGDWATDIQEAVNMVCFTMRVHSNLVGSVPGKGQTNNSGSDKRELYTIAQSLQKPYHDLLFGVHRLIIRFNGWTGVRPVCPFIQLTTLDEHRDAKTVDTNNDQP